MSQEKSPYLSAIEALRVSSLIENAYQKLELLILLSSDAAVLEAAQGAQETLDTESAVAAILDEQKRLGDRYEQLSFERGHESLRTSKEEQKQRREEMKEIQQKLRENTKLLCRNLKETPNESKNWARVRRQREHIKAILSSCKMELTSGALPLITFKQQMGNQHLGHTKDEVSSFDQTSKVKYSEFYKCVSHELATKKYLEEILEREQKTIKEVKQLKEQVKVERNLKEKEIKERTTIVVKLMSNLRELKSLTEEENEKNKATATSDFECRRRMEKATLKKLDDELRKVRLQYDIETEVSSQINSFLQKEKGELQQKLSEWQEKQKRETSQLSQEVGTWEARRRQQIAKKDKLQEKHAIELALKLEREKRAQEEKEAFETEKARKIADAATRIKLAYKCYKAREMFELRIKESKKKSKKKKSKKK